MKNHFKALCVVILAGLLMGCASNEKLDLHSERLNPANGADIWNSLQYEIITDLNTMRSIESEATEHSIMLHFYLRLENRGAKTAETFQAAFHEAIPLTYKNGSLYKGIDKGELHPNDSYEITGYYVFDKKEELEAFIEKSNFTMEWTEDKDSNRLVLAFPTEPTR
ncbi:hypothetical protein D3P08_21760 [Paenibacillus nanensis]|uniref:Lipoprotein n=1 Tax=Paenibacillus nanensis TaxID=393251 RepID=A0A3A1UX24_9BACL|nr:hypothetical protein [Paenibacillus nanensis]RIX49900.1 hypothetical protein D3P08_21760 [Paenibacillus nanensis]